MFPETKCPFFSAPPYKYTEYNAFTLTIILKHVSSGICSVITLEYVYLHLCSFYIVHFMTVHCVTSCEWQLGNKRFTIIFFAHQHKAAGVKTKQKQRLRRLLIRCSLCWGRRPHSPAAELWTGVETEKLLLWCPGWWLWCVCHWFIIIIIIIIQLSRREQSRTYFSYPFNDDVIINIIIAKQ